MYLLTGETLKINSKKIIFSKTYPNVAAIQHVVRIIVVSFIAFFLSHLLPGSENYWLILSVLLLVQIRIGNNILSQVGWMGWWGFLSACSIGIGGYFGDNIYFLSLYLFFISFLSVLMGLKYPQRFLPLCLFSVLTLLSSGAPVDGHFAIQRFDFVILGTAIVILVDLLFWPRSLTRYFFSTFSCCLDAVMALQKTFLEIYIKRDYPEKLYLYEKKIHQQNEMVLYFIDKLRFILSKNPQLRSETKNLDVVMRLHELAIAQGYLRFRIQDFTTFEIIARELTEWVNLAEVEEEPLNQIISTIEELYHSTLQIVATEPLAFLMFIQAMKDFNEELVNLKNG